MSGEYADNCCHYYYYGFGMGYCQVVEDTTTTLSDYPGSTSFVCDHGRRGTIATAGGD